MKIGWSIDISKKMPSIERSVIMWLKGKQIVVQKLNMQLL